MHSLEPLSVLSVARMYMSPGLVTGAWMPIGSCIAEKNQISCPQRPSIDKAPQLGLHEQIPSPCWIFCWLDLMHYCTGNRRHCESMCSGARLCPENTVLQRSSTTSDSSNLSGPSSAQTLEPWGQEKREGGKKGGGEGGKERKGYINVPFKLELYVLIPCTLTNCRFLYSLLSVAKRNFSGDWLRAAQSANIEMYIYRAAMKFAGR